MYLLLYECGYTEQQANEPFVCLLLLLLFFEYKIYLPLSGYAF